MGPIYRSLAAYEPLIYIALAIWSLFAFRSMYRSWREWQDSVYTLEREFALTRLVRATALALLILGSCLPNIARSCSSAPCFRHTGGLPSSGRSCWDDLA
jgi:hypothetical protein